MTKHIARLTPLIPHRRDPDPFDSALQAAYDAGVIRKDTLEFADGIALAGLELSWGESTEVSPVSGLDELYRTLNLTWNGGASEVQLVIPHYDDPLGSGVEQVRFADGTLLADVRDVLFGRCKFEAANDTEERMAA